MIPTSLTTPGSELRGRIGNFGILFESYDNKLDDNHTVDIQALCLTLAPWWRQVKRSGRHVHGSPATRGQSAARLEAERLARAARVSRPTVADFEAAKVTPIPNNLTAIVRALEDAGVQFGADDSVRLGSDRQ